MSAMNKPKHTDAVKATRKELLRYMADYSSTRTPPKGAKGGWYAVVTNVTGMVWLAHTTSFVGVFARYYHSGVIPKELMSRKDEGFSIFLTTKEIDIDQLRFVLNDTDKLLEHGTGDLSVEGKLYVITHTSGHYYLTKSRNNTPEHTIITRFIDRTISMKQSFHGKTNQPLQNFVSSNASDLLRGTGFTVREIGKFQDVNDAINMMNEYHIAQDKMVCLNHVFDAR